MAKKEYTKNEAAKLLGVTASAIQRRIERERIEARKNEKGQWVVVLDDSEIKKKKERAAKKAAKKPASKKTTPAKVAEKVSPPVVTYVSDSKIEVRKKEKGSESLGGILMSGNLVNTAMDFATDFKKKADDLTKHLVDKGEMQREEARKLAETLINKAESQKNTYLFKLLESIESIRSKIVTRQDIERLEKKIEILNKKIQSM